LEQKKGQLREGEIVIFSVSTNIIKQSKFLNLRPTHQAHLLGGIQVNRKAQHK
jgi:hypothetical protein